MATLTTAFLGVAHIHTPGFIKTLNDRATDVFVGAVYDHDAERGRQRAAELPGARFVADPEQIFSDPEITSVVVCSETNQHLELVVRAAEAGKHIFCEKPLGLGAQDASAMANAITKAGVTFQTGFFMRGSGVNQFIKREVAAGHLGKITRLRYTNCHQAVLDGWFDGDMSWIADAKPAGGGALLDLGAHVLDQVVDIFIPTLGEVTHVFATLGNQVGRYGTEIDEYGTGLLTFASGATAVLEASWVDPVLRSPVEIFGTEGQIQVIDGKVLYYSKHVDGADGKTPVTDLPPDAPHAFSLFWDALLGKPLAVPLVSVEQAALASTLMERLYQVAGRSTTASAGLRSSE